MKIFRNDIIPYYLELWVIFISPTEREGEPWYLRLSKFAGICRWQMLKKDFGALDIALDIVPRPELVGRHLCSLKHSFADIMRNSPIKL